MMNIGSFTIGSAGSVVGHSHEGASFTLISSLSIPDGARDQRKAPKFVLVTLRRISWGTGNVVRRSTDSPAPHHFITPRTHSEKLLSTVPVKTNYALTTW